MNTYKRNVQIADKFVRNYRHRCMLPRCENLAIRSHAIQKATIEEALAVDNHVYTINTSFLSMLHTDARKERAMTRISTSKAGTFSGYCPKHDDQLFFPAETEVAHKKHSMNVSLYLRSISLEYGRKREVSLFTNKLYELEKNGLNASTLRGFAQQETNREKYFFSTVYAPLFSKSIFRKSTKINYLVIPFTGNLEVSCCGIFNADSSVPNSIVAYNLISYNDMSYLSLTSLKGKVDYIEQFLKKYDGLKGIERILNDIAFLKGEEPLISPRLWNSLTLGKKRKITKALVHPNFRENETSLNIIKLPKDKSNMLQEEDFYRRIGMKDDLIKKTIHTVISKGK